MRTLVVMGSPRSTGNCAILAKELCHQLGDENVPYDLLKLANKRIKFCKHCGGNSVKESCPLKDDIVDLISNIDKYASIIIVSPIYNFALSALVKAFLDRLYASELKGKNIGAILVSGSGFFTGGANLAVESLRKTCEYCDAQWIGVVHKTTNDEILSLDHYDVVNINRLVNASRLAYNEEHATDKSCFIRG